MTDGKNQTITNADECDETKCSLWCESVKEFHAEENSFKETLKYQENKEFIENQHNQLQQQQQQGSDYPYVRESRSLSLSDGYAHLYWFHLPQQLTTTIMSGLSWINQLEISSILQNIVNNTLFRRRNSTPLADSLKSDNKEATSYSSSTLQSKSLAKLLNDRTIRTLKSSELIELDNLGLVELDNSEAGVGHEFENYKNDKPTWCDACANYLSTPVMNGSESDKKKDNILADNESDIGSCSTTAATVAVQTDHLMRIYIQCRKCKYVCHLKCLPMIRIDCRPAILIDEDDPSTRLRTRKSKPKNNHRHRNSVRFDGPLFPEMVETTPPVEVIEEIVDIDSNNNCNNQPDDQQTTSQVDSVSDVNEQTSSSAIPDDDQTTIYTSFDDSTTYDPDSSQSTSSSSYHNVTSSVETLSESVFQSDIESLSVSDKPNASLDQSSNKQCSTYNSTPAELLIPSLIINLKDKILKYNERIRSKGSGLGITLIDESKQLFRGFLKVHMNLTRPINVVAGKRPPSIYDIINEQEENAQQNQQRRTLTSFYMPRDTVKNIHITSENTTLHVIKEMLKKFKVVDNPQKFALYLRRRFPDEEALKDSNLMTEIDKNYEKAIGEFLNLSNSQNCLKRLHDLEKPLILQLEFGSFAPDCVDIVLQENDNADICWDAFEIPELKNFIKILDREESEHLAHIRSMYMDKKELIRAMVEREEAKLSSVNISHPNSPERFNGNGPPSGGNSAASQSGSSNSNKVIAN